MYSQYRHWQTSGRLLQELNVRTVDANDSVHSPSLQDASALQGWTSMCFVCYICEFWYLQLFPYFVLIKDLHRQNMTIVAPSHPPFLPYELSTALLLENLHSTYFWTIEMGPIDERFGLIKSLYGNFFQNFDLFHIIITVLLIVLLILRSLIRSW